MYFCIAMLWLNVLLWVYSIQLCCCPVMLLHNYYRCTFVQLCCGWTSYYGYTVYSFVVAQCCRSIIVMGLCAKWFAVLFLCLLVVLCAICRSTNCAEVFGLLAYINDLRIPSALVSSLSKFQLEWLWVPISSFHGRRQAIHSASLIHVH